jgi:hypothetical protein
MPHPISTLGAIHTVISLVPVAAGAHNLIRDRRIDPATGFGKLYLVSLTLSVLTAFGLSSTGGVNAGHILGVVALLAAFSGVLALRLGFLGRLGPYLSAFGLSFSFLLLLVPGTNETLSRLPPSHPLANGPQSPLVQGALLVWLLLFIAGFVAQCRRIYARWTGGQVSPAHSTE